MVRCRWRAGPAAPRSSSGCPACSPVQRHQRTPERVRPRSPCRSSRWTARPSGGRPSPGTPSRTRFLAIRTAGTQARHNNPVGPAPKVDGMTVLAPDTRAPDSPSPTTPSRFIRLLRGRPEDPRWVRPALYALLIGTGLLYIVALGASGWANEFYSAAVQAA